MVSPVLATLFVDKVAETVIQLILVQVMDVHRVIDVIPSERSHHQSMDQTKLGYRAWIHNAMPTSVLPLPQDSARNFAAVAQRAPVKSSDHAVSGSKILGDALDGQE